MQHEGVYRQRPPGPYDIEQWDIILKDRPECAPAVEKIKPDLCRMADGTASWLEFANVYLADRLRAMGNGVDPMVAAIAWQVLAERFNK